MQYKRSNQDVSSLLKILEKFREPVFLLSKWGVPLGWNEAGRVLLRVVGENSLVLGEKVAQVFNSSGQKQMNKSWVVPTRSRKRIRVHMMEVIEGDYLLVEVSRLR